jgi:hypothetical protein
MQHLSCHASAEEMEDRARILSFDQMRRPVLSLVNLGTI